MGTALTTPLKFPAFWNIHPLMQAAVEIEIKVAHSEIDITNIDLFILHYKFIHYNAR